MCGIFGAYNQNGASVLEDIYLGLYALQHRGQESAGVAWISEDKLHIKKGLGLVHEALSQNELAKIDANYAIGHVRYATSEDTTNRNSQPLGANYSQGPVAIAHNGNLTNFIGLAGYLENKGAIFHTSTDTEVILQLMAHQPSTIQLDALETSLAKLRGAYSIAVIINGALVAARDPWGFRPLVLGKKDNTYYISSESCALDLLGAELVRDIEPGEILIIEKDKITSRKIAVTAKRCRHCSFEYVYFARPDSTIDGSSVYYARKKLGKVLCKNCTIPENSIIAGMPDSGTLAALGMAEETKLPFEVGVVRNRYVGRTFIQPTQRVREAGVKIKLNPQPDIFNGKEAIIVDDSLVRGTTAQRIVSMIKESGAEKVHIKIASPPVTHPCYYGINTPTSDELIATQISQPELCKMIEADTLTYITCDELSEAIGIPKDQLCTACFDGSYMENEEFENIKDI